MGGPGLVEKVVDGLLEENNVEDILDAIVEISPYGSHEKIFNWVLTEGELEIFKEYLARHGIKLIRE